jgi:predicted metal-dependent phosphoesterase TrpH
MTFSTARVTDASTFSAGAAAQHGVVVLVGGLRRQVPTDQHVRRLVIDVHQRCSFALLRPTTRAQRDPRGRLREVPARNTVKTHVVSIYRKLAAADRSEAVARARELGLVTSDT